MAETQPNHNSEQNLSPVQSTDAYSSHLEQVFNQLETEPDPLMVDVEASELLFLILKHPEFSQIDRFREMVSVAQLTMSRMYKYTQPPDHDPAVVKRAEMIHHTYAQLFAYSLVEWAKLAEPSSQVEPT